MTAAHLATVLDVLSLEAEVLILDLPGVTAEGVRYVLERADQILLVAEPETFSIACACADIATLKAWGVLDGSDEPGDCVAFPVNQAPQERRGGGPIGHAGGPHHPPRSRSISRAGP